MENVVVNSTETKPTANNGLAKNRLTKVIELFFH